VEAALSFIGIDSFLRDPKGLTCITLHSFTDFFEVFTSDTVTDGPCRCPGFRKPVPEREPAKSGIRENHLSPFFKETAGGLSGYHSNRNIALRDQRSMA
jgi:hypothetical protein